MYSVIESITGTKRVFKCCWRYGKTAVCFTAKFNTAFLYSNICASKLLPSEYIFHCIVTETYISIQRCGYCLIKLNNIIASASVKGNTCYTRFNSACGCFHGSNISHTYICKIVLCGYSIYINCGATYTWNTNISIGCLSYLGREYCKISTGMLAFRT